MVESLAVEPLSAEAFAALARERSQDPAVSSNGGDLGLFTRQQVPADGPLYRRVRWGKHLEDAGFRVTSEDVRNISEIKARYSVPVKLQYCHTAIVDGYIIEGHVPVSEVERLLTDRPDIAGLSVPGMPPGSPGMEVSGGGSQPYDVIAFDKAGNMQVFASFSN